MMWNGQKSFCKRGERIAKKIEFFKIFKCQVGLSVKSEDLKVT